MQKVLAVLAGILLLFNSAAARAEVSNEELLKEIRALKTRVTELEGKLNAHECRIEKTETIAEMQKEKIKCLDTAILRGNAEPAASIEGLNIGASATMIVQGTCEANGDALSEQGQDVTDGSYSIDLEFEKEFGDKGIAFIHLETGDGAGIEDELNVYSSVNRDADDSDNGVSLTEVWYEHCFKPSAPLTLMAGKIDATILVDTNQYANDETAQFLGRMFRNSPVIELPDNSAGLKATLSPFEFADIDLLAMDADGDWEDVGDEAFLAAQINLKPNLLDRDGNYRFIGWLSNRNHTEWNNVSNNKEKAYGFGISFDQELTDSLAAFTRYGWQDPDVYLNGDSFSLEQAYSLGLQLKGTRWGREDDTIACAIGQIFPSGDYKDANNLNAETEGHFEAYYSFKANDHLTLSPDLHVIWNPYGDDAALGKDTITVYGLRGQVDF